MADVRHGTVAHRTAALCACLTFSVLLAACGGSGGHSASTPTASQAVTSTPAEPNTADGARAALAALQVAISNHDVKGTCTSLLPDTATQARGSAHAVDASIAAVIRDCESGFGQRGEFAGYAPLSSATVTRVAVRGRLATIEANSSRGRLSLRFLYLGGAWRMLIATDS